MKDELEIQIMNTFYRAYENEDRRYLREYEIASRNKIKQSNLKRVLPRLVKRGWVEIKKAYSFTGKEPEGTTFHLSFEESNNIPKEAINQYYKEKYDVKIQTLPIQYVAEFYRQLPRLKQIKTGFDYESIPYTKSTTLKEVLEDSHPNKRSKTLRDRPFKGKKELWKDILLRGTMKEYTFYRMVYYPFLTRKVTIGENSFEKFNVPKGKKRMWVNAATEMRNEIKGKKSPLELLFSENKIR